jgi:hypothetical protein
MGIIEMLAERTGKSTLDALDYCLSESERLSDLLLLVVENWMALALRRNFLRSQ